MTFFIALLFTALALILFYVYLTWNYNHWEKLGIASEKPIPIFGNMLETCLGRKVLGEIFVDMYRKYPTKKVVGWYKFRQPALVIRDPALVRRILLTDFNSFRNNDISVDENLDPILGRNIFVLKDDMWKKNRGLITPAFTAGKIKAVYPIMIEVAKELVEYLKKHPEEIHVKHTMSRYTSEIVARCGLGIDGNNFKEKTPEMVEMGKLLFEPGLQKNLKFISSFLFPQLIKFFRVKVVSSKVIDFFDRILKDVIVYRQENNVERNDFLQYLISVKRKTLEVAKGTVESDLVTRTYSDDDVLAGCIMFFIEANETSSLVMTNILYHLAKYKHVQDKLRKEVDEAFKEGEITFEKLHEMPYLNGVFLETNRLLPVLFSLHKKCTERCELDIGELKPLVIEKDTPIGLPIFALHNDPNYWTDCDTFEPERFLNKEDADAKAKGIFLPFGEGPRMCPGSRIAITFIKLAIIYICKNMEILKTSKTPEKIEPDPHYFMIGHKGGMYLRFDERSL